MVSAFISLPAAFLALRLEGRSAPAALVIMGSLHLFGTLLFAAIAGLTKRLLNRQFAFHATDRQIDLMILANIAVGLLAVTGVAFPPLKETVSQGALAALIFQGVMQILFGYKLQQLPDSVGGMLKPYCYLNIATGVCIASVVLIIIGVVSSAISDLMLGTIFFNIAQRKREAE